ncbi:unnamed protein product [Trifolium pratense]|uniref:Uncharacterized protein n=1 Tax=Trifolium pratense TaxID=57577 RepID=A0ACB0J773_TRIPR|nr:unnamed protein product [Trifolium pratense]
MHCTGQSGLQFLSRHDQEISCWPSFVSSISGLILILTAQACCLLFLTTHLSLSSTLTMLLMFQCADTLLLISRHEIYDI